MTKQQFKIEVKKKGIESPQYVAMSTLDDVFKHSLTLSEKDTEKMMRELLSSVLICRKLLISIGKENTTDIFKWKWAND